MQMGLRVVLGLAASIVAAAAADAGKPPVEWMQTALDRWAVACRKYLHIGPHPLPWIIFFDDRSAWHLNPDKSMLPAGERAGATLKFAGTKHHVIQVEHRNRRLWVPDRDPLPVRPGGAAMPYADGRKVFFQLALPSLWQKESGSARTRDLDELILGFALHELTHTRQLAAVASRIEALRSRVRMPESVHDNLIENTFGEDNEFKKIWLEEWSHIQRAVLAGDSAIARQAIAEVLAISERRRARFFVKEYEGWSELEDIFLAMEGLGMWVHYRMARDFAPRGEDWRQTLAALTSRSDAWSQIQGLGLMLLIDRFIPGWQANFLGADLPSPFAVLGGAVKTNR